MPERTPTHGVVDLEVAFYEDHRPHHQHAGHDADDSSADGTDERAGAVMATRPASMPLAVMDGVGLAPDLPDQEHGRQASGGRSDERVDDHGEAQIGRRQGRGPIEAHPAEHQDDDAQDGHGHVVSRGWPAACRPCRTCRCEDRAPGRARQSRRNRQRRAPRPSRRSPPPHVRVPRLRPRAASQPPPHTQLP